MQDIFNKFNTLMSAARNPGGETQENIHRSRGKLLVRERIEVLLDPGSPFLELSPLAGTNIYEGVGPGAGIVTGIGLVSGTMCMIVANDATVKGGTYFPITVKKHLRAQDIACENMLPCIYLVDSGGAFLPMQDEVFPDRFHFGRIFFNQANLSAAGIPQIACVMGSCTAGGAYVPAMSDQVVMVKDQGTIFLGGPPLVKAATGEVVSAEDLGGAYVHSEISGVSDYTADDDYQALEQVKKIISNLNFKHTVTTKVTTTANVFSSNLSIKELIPEDTKKPFPMREVITKLVDNSEIDEFKKQFGQTLICCFASIAGYKIGIIANDGILFSESAMKGAHFIQLCCQRNIPLLFLQNIVGFMVGKSYEHGGIAKHGAKFVTAVASAKVPKVTVVVGGSFGAGNYAMCGRAYDPAFLFTWPNSRTAVMGPEQAASVLTEVRRDSVIKKGGNPNEKELKTYEKNILDKYTAEADAIYSTARLWDDGIIDPDDTRRVLELVMEVISNRTYPETKFGIFRM